MKRFPLPTPTIVLGVLSLAVSGARAGSAPTSEEQIRDGRYLATDVAMCVDCHSPKLKSGLLDPERILMGTEITVAPLEPVADWVTYAPAIAGLPNYSREEVIEVLMTGMIGDIYLRPPMPVFQLNREDAEAIVAYLAALQPSETP